MRKVQLVCGAGLLLAVGGLVIGCTPSPPAAVDNGSQAELKRIDTASLPELDEPLPVLDRGRLSVAGPVGWTPAPRRNPFLAWFVRDSGDAYPAILITAEDCPSFPDVDQTNVRKYAEFVAAQEQLPRVVPVAVGDFVGVEYHKLGRPKGRVAEIIERLVLETAAGGRRYKLELRTKQGELQEARPALYAVAAGIKFTRSQKTPEQASGLLAAPAAPGAVSEEKPSPPAPSGRPGGGAKGQPAAPQASQTTQPAGAAERPPAAEAKAKPAPAAEKPKAAPEAASERKTQQKIDLDKELEGLFDFD